MIRLFVIFTFFFSIFFCSYSTAYALKSGQFIEQGYFEGTQTTVVIRLCQRFYPNAIQAALYGELYPLPDNVGNEGSAVCKATQIVNGNVQILVDVGTIPVQMIPSCQAGQSSYVVYRTTIASITSNLQAIMADMPPNPGCVQGCVSVYPVTTTTSVICSAYLALGVQPGVGVEATNVCHAGYMLDGRTCNFDQADVLDAVNSVPLPPGAQPLDLPAPPNTNPIPVGGGGGGGLSVAAENALQNIDGNTDDISGYSQQISESVVITNETLGQIASNQATTDTNQDARHGESLNALGQIKDAIDYLATLMGGTGSGGGGGGDPGDGGDGGGTGGNGNGLIRGPHSVGTDVPEVEVPERGNMSVGEGLEPIQSLLGLRNSSFGRSAGECPTFNFEVPLFNKNYVMDTHCEIFNRNAGTIEAVMTVVWTLSALIIVLRA